METPHRYHFKTISEYHKLAGLPKPGHPLVSVVNMADVKMPMVSGQVSMIYDFYSIALKRVPDATIKYGQQICDFDDGVLFFMAPGQVFTVEVTKNREHHPTGWMILFHADLLWGTHLAKVVKQYDFFDYSLYEALHVSELEENTLNAIAAQITAEANTNIDGFTQQIIIAQLELLLSYSERFYQRQFITRKTVSHEILNRLEDLIAQYFRSGDLINKGLPTVNYIANKLNISAGYLTAMLKSLIGQSTQQYLHEKLIELAKEKLSTSSRSVSEISYELGFEHLQSFSRLFKTKTNLSPKEFRESFN
ncbi:helix-turn-helix domain-containing protein [Pedobacter endophyticus]|uniref:Helix-turn-helix transcriptional regulator n=1 Tax=Pedobacter endophyticus TaxID=2789740 RepID=A0A7S9PZP2_9SPHI|nr:helix-turn-helix transcriptional regulator [Pedobacter endophyticus]QPH40743.1 helix-turn-helix transcriptional regulator [Pedobacter endophyticus]